MGKRILVLILVFALVAAFVGAGQSTRARNQTASLDTASSPGALGDSVSLVYLYMSVTGATQGIIEGSANVLGHEGDIALYGYDHDVFVPRDGVTGQAAGVRVHTPVKVFKMFDKASPKLYQALSTGELLTDVVIRYYRINPTGSEENHFTVQLQNARIVDIKAGVPNYFDPEYPVGAVFTHMEQVSFTYQSIMWTWEPDNIASEDDWESPVA